MKHAILIMAHKHFDHLKHLIEYFNRDCFVFVHVDKRSLFKREEIETILQFIIIPAIIQHHKILRMKIDRVKIKNMKTVISS